MINAQNFYKKHIARDNSLYKAFLLLFRYSDNIATADTTICDTGSDSQIPFIPKPIFGSKNNVKGARTTASKQISKFEIVVLLTA